MTVEVPGTNQVKTLRDVLPREALSEGYNFSEKKLNAKVVATNQGYRRRWPGRQKNVVVWWELDDGTACGWNENTSVGWSFPIIRLRK